MLQALTSKSARHICSKSLYTNNLVVDAGFEPAKAMPADLQSALVVHLSNLPKRLEQDSNLWTVLIVTSLAKMRIRPLCHPAKTAPVGFEPTTYKLTVCRTTVVLQGIKLIPGLGFEPRQREPKSLVLPLHYPGEPLIGVEPITF